MELCKEYEVEGKKGERGAEFRPACKERKIQELVV